MRKVLLFATFLSMPLAAQTLSFSIQSGASSIPLGATYSFPDTPQSSSSSIVLSATNTGTVPLVVIDINVENSSFSAQNPNFTVTGTALNDVLAPGASEPFTVNFAPTATGAQTGYLQVAYFAEQNGCSTSTPSGCVASISTVSTLEGNATAPAIVVSYSNGGVNTVLQPNSASPLNFGNVNIGSTNVITFTITNQSSVPMSTPDVTLQVEIYNSSAFQLSTTGLPLTLAAGASSTFTVTFAPGQVTVMQANLLVGSLTFPLQGAGVSTTTLDQLAIVYMDSTGTRTIAEPATSVDFGSLIAGTNSSTTLTFILANPLEADQSFNTMTVPVPQISGAGFAMVGAPTTATTLQPGGENAVTSCTANSSSCIEFTVTFTPSGTGSYSGTLSIGSLSFTLSGQEVASSLPSVTFQLSSTPLLSQQQVNLTIQSPTPSQVAAVGELTLQFTPSVANVSDDPAVVFLATNTRQLQVALAVGSQNATYNGQTAIAFQTGTTAGTITFTLTFTDAPPYSQSFTIAPAQIFITSAQAVTETPNLVVTINGYDNTYSAGDLSFLFYDTNGNKINPSGLQVNASTDFHNYFFTNNQAGGAFALQATFPVTGDATQVGSVAVTLTNSAGQTTKTLSFQ